MAHPSPADGDDPQDLTPTPGQTVGPFFGYALAYERGHELVAPASAGAIRLHGTVLDGRGEPVPDALIEISQADAAGTVSTEPGALVRDGMVFSGWGRCATDHGGGYSFSTVAPGPVDDGLPFIAVVVFARGLLNRLFTRAYLPQPEVVLAGDPLLSRLDPGRRRSLVTTREADGSLRFDIRLQGAGETVFLRYTRHDA